MSGVTQSSSSCHTPGEQPEGQERGCLCLAGCSQGVKQPWTLPMEFRLGESLQGSAVCSGSSVEQSKSCCHSSTVWANIGTGKVPVHQHSSLCRDRQGSTETMGGAGTGGDNGSAGSCQGLQIHTETDFLCLIGKVTSEFQRNGKNFVQVPVHRWWHRAENPKVPNP